MIRVLLADPRPLVWAGLNAVLCATADLSLLPDIATEQTLPRLCAQLTPELLLLSLLFVPGESARPLAGLQACCPQTRTMLLVEAGGRETQDVKALLTTGHVHGLISLTEPAAAWPVALRTVVSNV
jgi:DNA-binding NarL/FixJ family response regulator